MCIVRPVAAGALGPQSLGEALCLLRRRAGMNRNHLAAAAGLSSGALANYENDASAPSAAALRRLTRMLAECLDCDVAELWEQFGTLLEGNPRLAPREVAAHGVIESISSRVPNG